MDGRPFGHFASFAFDKRTATLFRAVDGRSWEYMDGTMESAEAARSYVRGQGWEIFQGMSGGCPIPPEMQAEYKAITEARALLDAAGRPRITEQERSEY
jgi:hypothetical protein